MHSKVRRDAWEKEFLKIGLSGADAWIAASSQSQVLSCKPDGVATYFQRVFPLLLSRAGITRIEVLSMLKHLPLIAVSNVRQLHKSLTWLKNIAGFSLPEIKELVLADLYGIQSSSSALPEKLELFVNAGYDLPAIRDIWLQSPWMLTCNCDTLKAKLDVLEMRLSLSKMHLLGPGREILGYNINTIKVRTGLLTYWDIGDVNISRLSTCTTHLWFAEVEVDLQVKASGKSISMLSSELLQEAGVSAIMSKMNVQPDTMTALQYYTVFSKWYLAVDKAQQSGGT